MGNTFEWGKNVFNICFHHNIWVHNYWDYILKLKSSQSIARSVDEWSEACVFSFSIWNYCGDQFHTNEFPGNFFFYLAWTLTHPNPFLSKLYTGWFKKNININALLLQEFFLVPRDH